MSVNSDSSVDVVTVSDLFLQVVRQCKLYLMWQREQGWVGIPCESTRTWGSAQEDEISTLLWTDPRAEQVPKTPARTEKQSGDTVSRHQEPWLRQGQESNPPLSWRPDFLGESSVAETRPPASAMISASAVVERVASSYGVGEPTLEQTTTGSPWEVVEVGEEQWAQEPSLVLDLLRSHTQSEQTQREAALLALHQEWRNCQRCARSQERTCVVVGQGAVFSRLMLISEGPKAEQDQTGTWWIGPESELLQLMLQSVGIQPHDVFVSSVVKCVSSTSPPYEQELMSCFPLMEREIEIIRPDFLITLGAVATQTLLGVSKRLATLRGQWRQHPRGFWVLPTFSPDYLLSRPAFRKQAWQDWLVVRERLLAEQLGKN